MSLVVGVDPGKATGCVVWDEVNGFTASVYGEDNEPLKLFWQTIAALDKTDTVVCEDYVSSPGAGRRSSQRDALWVIGGLKALSVLNGFELVFQSPAEGKGFADNRRLAAMWFDVSGVSRHVLDALRHLVLSLSKRKIVFNPSRFECYV